ncbi:GPI-anchor transamidase complex subunit Gaa1 [Schizosaccharomyces cryophilus OY26]|uniref:GPI-anchor transamidase complex subunit Gaa1 n=1 Tax=Schizosaccharomyces cryophilus (strain OY26 / ATCC MYA-4695 / CBS 11777 / NBRC 106824 / NRRL Y48691) TaxID=653667 RepID=S9W6F9_SCHCR|nr:GPI-anchor transamidase complex subunit Gaa1 [Schizosaccharomyces cryophilus OY26]EPY53415.1 GPI-anchor transamidase complex subunit Gaa1 [Schizosaccharomyces cryophilus OY26]
MSVVTRLQSKLVPFITRHLLFFQIICTLIGAFYIFLLPSEQFLSRLRVSENALLPGQVNTYFGNENTKTMRAALSLVRGWSNKDEVEELNPMFQDLEAIFTTMGMAVQRQKYTTRIYEEYHQGSNFYTVFRSPRGDATESLLLCVPWKDYEGYYNEAGLALAISLMKYFQGWSLWSKDIILLIPDHPVSGTYAFLSAYHDQTPAGYNIDRLWFKAGTIQAALAMELPRKGYNNDVAEILYQAANGQLPNLDLFNAVAKIFMSSFMYSLKLQGEVYNAYTPSDYFSRLKALTRGMASQAVSNLTNAHSLFPQYKIDALTVRIEAGDPFTFDMTRCGQAIESSFRSLNNLLEHLHQSYFFYFLLNQFTFVSIGDYMPAVLLIAASLMIGAYRHWISHPKHVNLWKPFCLWLLNMVTAFSFMYTGFLTKNAQNPVALVVAYAVACIGLFLLFRPSRQETQLTLAFSLMSKSLLLTTVSTLNFSLAFLIGLWLTAIQFLTFSSSRFLLYPLLSCVFLAPILFPIVIGKVFQYPFHSWFHSYILYGSWLMPFSYTALLLCDIPWAIQCILTDTRKAKVHAA